MNKTNIFARGSALIEVMVTIFILGIGILGIAGLQARIHVLEYESYQRAQAVVILNDLADRIAGNRNQVDAYVAAAPAWLVSTGNVANCWDTTVADTAVKRDLCEVGNLLKGAGEKQGATGLGAMDSGRACVTAYTDTTSRSFNRCQTGVQIDVAWRGKSATVVPAATCGLGTYGTSDAVRRVISTRVGTGDIAVGTGSC